MFFCAIRAPLPLGLLRYLFCHGPCDGAQGGMSLWKWKILFYSLRDGDTESKKGLWTQEITCPLETWGQGSVISLLEAALHPAHRLFHPVPGIPQKFPEVVRDGGGPASLTLQTWQGFSCHFSRKPWPCGCLWQISKEKAEEKPQRPGKPPPHRPPGNRVR